MITTTKKTIRTKKPKAIVTGCTGAIGISLINKLLNEGYAIYAVAHKNSKRIDNIPSSPDVSIIECNLENIDKLPGIINEKCDIFFHLAWAGTFGNIRNAVNIQADNIKFAVNAVEAANKLGCKIFLGAGSQAEYGLKSQKLSSDMSENPINGYGIAKLCAGRLTRILCGQYGIKHIWCRILSVYGPYDAEYTMIMSSIIKMLEGESISYTKGEQMWDYLYSDDAAEALFLSAKNGIDGKIYCVGSGNAIPLKNYIEKIKDYIGSESKLGFGDIPYNENSLMYLCADISQLTKDTGFIPKHTFDEGIRTTIDWCKEYYRKG